ncbi:MAG TPA: hypothetical protein VJ826_03045 [Candidatus Polarisedimenticolaceae bacterium]|nr:hypothetical protein [Candidatus Polarisedimenticolaceae bacterium]
MRHPVIAPLVAGALLLSPAVAKEKKKMADQFTGTLVSMTAPGAMGSRVQIWIDSYTPDDVAEGLIKTLSEQGQRALLDKVTDLDVGRIRVGTSNGYPISVARQRVAADGSRTIVLATSRPFVGFAPNAGTRIEDYPFGLIELKLAADGTGEGTLVGAAQLAFDPTTKDLSVKTYATQPSRLTTVKPVK